MKSFIVLCSLAALACVFISFIEAKPGLRQKRGLHQEDCPSTMTVEQCKSYAEDKRNKSEKCIRAEVMGHHIEWADCGKIMCGDNTRPVPADLSKSYPDCCPSCEAIDPSKEGSWSASGK